MKNYDLIESSILTEKTSFLQDSFKKVTFYAKLHSNKKQIKELIESSYSVKVKSINSLILKGKAVNFRGVKGKRKNRKKMIVTLEKGSKIDFGE
ncbi:50S ribosomal protein L23 [Rickettsiales bacterium]|nr:50S ribosomal protein L23 [Rickettsiales bacterium]